MSEQQRYPVLVECTEYHLIWVEAESAEDALSYVTEDSEYLTGSTPYDGDYTVTGPRDAWDWESFYATVAPKHDAHVQAHERELWRLKREAARAACTEAGHPESETYRNGDTWCRTCGEYLAKAGGDLR